MPTIEYYMTLSYPIIVQESTCTDGSPCYEAKHPDIPGCMGQGDSISEAIEDLHHAKYLYIESLIEDGLPVPASSDPLPEIYKVCVTIGSMSQTPTDINIIDVSTMGSSYNTGVPSEPIKWEQLQYSMSI